MLDSVYTLIKEYSLHRDEADWTQIDADFVSRIDTATSFASALGAFSGVFEALDDVHSAIYYEGNPFGYWRQSAEPSARDVSALIDLSRERAGQPVGRPLPGAFGYLLVPSYGTRDREAIDAAAEGLREVVCSLAPSAANGWIIDLRLNEGGNVYPMLSGLGELLGDGLAARSVSASGDPHATWSIRDGVLFIDDYQTATVEHRCPDAHTAAPIAVLVGPATLSSGQLTAVAFAGWHRARLFGDPTSDGYATGNQWYQVTPALGLNLSVSYFADAPARSTKASSLPDEVVPGEWRFDVIAEDPVVRRALEWLREK